MTSIGHMLLGFAVVSTSFLSGSFQHVGAQSADEAATTSEPNLQEPGPSSEPALEEPALQLKLDSAGVEVVPSQPRTVDGYTLEEMELRVKRARIGLLSTTGVAVVGAVLFGAGGGPGAVVARLGRAIRRSTLDLGYVAHDQRRRRDDRHRHRAGF